MSSRGRGYLTLHEFMWKDLGLSGVPLLVYARIYGFSGGASRGFFESRSATAEFLGVSERAVTKAIGLLIARGLIREVGTHRLRSGRCTKVYRSVPVASAGWAAPTVTNCHSGASSERPSGERRSPEGRPTSEPRGGPPMNPVHPIEDRYRKPSDSPEGGGRFAKYDD